MNITLAGMIGGLVACAAFPPAVATAAPPPGYTLAWSEDFRQEPGTPPDSARWSHDLGAGGWGNAELQTYVKDSQNAQVVKDPFAADGRALAITTMENGKGGYTSARISTKDKARFQYGYIEARIKLPRGQGIWPAFWMLGADIGDVGWPKSGEIDIMENIGREPTLVHGSLHGPGYFGGDSLTFAGNLPRFEAFHERYHTFGVEWRIGSITFVLDGTPYGLLTPDDVPKGGAWSFDKPFYFILNVAVGGHWPGPPDKTTRFPRTMNVDYVRVYREKPAPTGAAGN